MRHMECIITYFDRSSSSAPQTKDTSPRPHTDAQTYKHTQPQSSIPTGSACILRLSPKNTPNISHADARVKLSAVARCPFVGNNAVSKPAEERKSERTNDWHGMVCVRPIPVIAQRVTQSLVSNAASVDRKRQKEKTKKKHTTRTRTSDQLRPNKRFAHLS